MEKQRPLIGLLINEADRNYLSRALYYIQKEFFAVDMDVAVFSTQLTRGDGDYLDLENEIFELINPEYLDGAIVFLQSLNSENIKRKIVDKLKGFDKPVVIAEVEEEGFDSVVFDDSECTKVITEHLVKCHDVKNIIYVSGPKMSDFHNRILDGFRRSFAEYDIVIDENNTYHRKDWEDDYGSVADDIIKKGLPDAVVCCSDFTASAVVGELSKRGVRVPEDVIVSGYSKNEPYVANYINITTTERSPEKMAKIVAHKIIAAVKGEEYEPVGDIPSCKLCTGMTCGCGEINYPALARSAMDSMIQNRCDGFDSYYNFMSEELIAAQDFEDYLWKLDWYTFYIPHLERFWMCLNDHIMHSEDSPVHYTDKMDMPFCRANGVGNVDFNRSFDKKLMLPELFEKREKPCAFVFIPLHFSHVNFGYTVLSFGDSGAMYDITLAKWLRYVTCALEKHRRYMIYNDAVVDAQIRDSLTGLLNMRGFKQIMSKRCGKFDRDDKLLRIISVDVENLGGINNAYGYSEGDRLLQKLAVILNNCAGDEDICVRVSGDEFIIAGLIDAAVPVDEVPHNLERNLNAYNSGNDSEYGIHIFTSRVTAPINNPEILDTLPYEANYQRTLTKDNHNKSRKVAADVKEEEFDPEERKNVSKLLNDNLLKYCFQPIVDAITGEIVAYEALMRSAGEIKLSPVAILNHASALGRLMDVERLTMSNLLSFLNENSEHFEDKKLFINSIPSCTLPDKDFDVLYSKYRAIMDKVVVEFTEQTEANHNQLEKILERSKKMGFKIAIDDYGTGYSNISNLLTFMPNCVKIDRSLINNIHEDKRKQHFTKNIIEYAHDNNFSVLAEGVERSEELKTVIDMGIDLIQGYFTAKPSEKLIKNIDSDVLTEIKDYNKLVENRVARKTYFTGNETQASLMSLGFDNYTDIFVGSSEFTLVGSSDYISDILIRIKDGINCKLNLVDVSMKNEHGESCIHIGNNTKLTLNISGNVSISGAITVPETSSIDIVGDGTFTMASSLNNQSYGIGCGVDDSYGNIGIHLKNRMFIYIDSDRCTAIGGGYNNSGSKIIIDTPDLEIEQSGVEVIALGSFYSSPIVRINNTKLNIKQQCSQGIGIGSMNKSLDVVMEDSELHIDNSGNKLGGICAYTSKCSSVNIDRTVVDIMLRGKDLHGIGTDDGEFAITMHECDMNIACNGADVVAMGSDSENSTIELYNCNGTISVKSDNGKDILVTKQENFILDECDITMENNP